METIVVALRVLLIVGSTVARSIQRATNAIVSAIAWLICLAMAAIIAGLAVAATVSLGPRFEIATVAAVLLTTLFLVAFRLRRKPSRIRDPHLWYKRRARKMLFIWIAIFALGSVTLLIVGVEIVSAIIDHRARPQDAEAALESFVPKYAPDVDQARLERTLAEFERIRRDFADQWVIPASSPRIRLRLFRDADDYRAYTSGKRIIEWSSGYVSCSENGVSIVVPLEEASNVLDELPISSTTKHEMMHAMWCQRLGAESFWSIPLWFHEGMAERYGNKGIERPDREIINRWWVWFSRDNLLSPLQFCNYQLTGVHTEIGLFYATSWEFIRSLEASNGIQTLNSLVEDVGGGKDFEGSLSDRVGGTCDELYREWTQSFSIYS